MQFVPELIHRWRSRTRHLGREIEPRVLAIIILLITIDIILAAIHLGHELYVHASNGRTPLLSGRWDIDTDRSYAEIVGYGKCIAIIAILASAYKSSKAPLYLVFAAMFAYVLIDDALLIHERLGRTLAHSSDAVSHRDMGQLVVWMACGIILLAAALAALTRASGRHRTHGLLLLLALAMLGFFAVAVDLAHVVLRSSFHGADLLFTMIEELGEQLVLSLTVGLVILIRRVVAGGATQLV